MFIGVSGCFRVIFYTWLRVGILRFSKKMKKSEKKIPNILLKYIIIITLYRAVRSEQAKFPIY
ncbi:MAG TPA: hypothetical protein DDX37_10465 [Candidatus Omnitrophica bacterium]|nr:hypothetical protein [Candidatus Omnitrophota bacterium]